MTSRKRFYHGSEFHVSEMTLLIFALIILKLGENFVLFNGSLSELDKFPTAFELHSNSAEKRDLRVLLQLT